jgi:hypothetical protein
MDLPEEGLALAPKVDAMADARSKTISLDVSHIGKSKELEIEVTVVDPFNVRGERKGQVTA